MPGTERDDYAERLVALSNARWRRLLDVQAPYRWHLRHHRLGRTLDIGCGIGRNLVNLDDGSVGVDHNEKCVDVARARGCRAFTPEEWQQSDFNRTGHYDALLLAHVVEHMTRDEARDLLTAYLPALRHGGKVLFICPQERGYRSDPTHVEFVTGQDLVDLATSVSLQPERPRSFPLPRWAGRVFPYNEFTLVAHRR